MTVNAAEGRAHAGVFRFMSAATEPSLFRNGRVLVHRAPDGGTTDGRGFDLEPHTLDVGDARCLPERERPTCAMNGFELTTDPLPDGALDFLDHALVVERYYPRCAALVARITGAAAFPFDHNVRSASGQKRGERIRGGQGVQPPAHVVHGDYTLRGAPERVLQLAEPPNGNDTLVGFLPPGASLVAAERAQRALAPGGRFAIINVWRNIAAEPVATHPLALCDGRTVEPEDLVVFEIHYPNRIGENYFARFSPRQRMYFYSAMTRDEALLIKQWDSAGSLARTNGEHGDASRPDAPCTFSFHSAFEDPSTPPDAPDRWSVEVRCLVLYD